MYEKQYCFALCVCPFRKRGSRAGVILSEQKGVSLAVFFIYMITY